MIGFMRSIWSGSLSFGLINIPVKMYSGQETQAGLNFRMLDKKTLSPIRYIRISGKDGKEVPYDNIVKGYQIQEGDYIILTDEDFQKASRQRQKTIDIQAFVDEAEIDDRFYEKPYYLEPQEGAESAYALLRESLSKSKKVAVAKYVLRNRDNLASIAPLGNALTMYELRFQNEIREPSALNLPSKEATTTEQVNMALTLIDHLTKHFVPEDYHDTYSDEIRDIIDKKSKGRPIRSRGRAKQPTSSDDIMAKLKASLEKAGS